MSEKSIYQSLMNVQQQIPMIKKNANGYGYKYTTLEELINEVIPLCSKEGLFLTCESSETKQLEVGSTIISVKTVFYNSNGERFDGYNCEFKLPLDTKNYGQAVGSLITYGRRYSLCATLSIAVTDDDAILASNNLATIMKNQYEELMGILIKYAKIKGKPVDELIEWIKKITNKNSLEKLTQEEFFSLKEKFEIRKAEVDE